MGPNKTQQFINSYPKIFAHEKFIACGDGWYHLLDSLCLMIEAEVSSLPLELQDQIYIQQVKTKLGGLRFSMSHTTPKIDGAIELAEELSNNICERCGNFGDHKSINGWITTLCIDHYNEELSRMEQ